MLVRQHCAGLPAWAHHEKQYFFATTEGWARNTPFGVAGIPGGKRSLAQNGWLERDRK
jgi:hypothetical protein